MTWRNSLVRLADFEVEELRKRLAEVLDRKMVAEMRLAMLHAEAEAENSRTDDDAQAGWYRLGFLQGWRIRRDALLAEIASLSAEEEGARDALGLAFEDFKKYEQVAENARAAQVMAAAKRDR
ncbi:MAG: flagellar export protein FliJ, partial [Caulobacteraceae bacterium]